jgi:hypothetical protein
MAFVQSDVDALKKAIVSGVASVRFADGRRVDYRGVSELQTALALAEAEVAASAGASSVSYASFGKD